MSTNWRISSFNGALLATYFIPTWSIIAFNMVMSPVHAFFERLGIEVIYVKLRTPPHFPKDKQ